MTAEELNMLVELRKLERQVHATIDAVESGAMKFNVAPKQLIQGWEIGDFVITPRVPKTDFHG